MIDDLTARRFGEHAQRDSVRAVKNKRASDVGSLLQIVTLEASDVRLIN